MVFLIVLAIIILLCLAKIKADIHTDNAEFSIAVYILGIIKIKRKYVIRREKKKILTLYRIGKNEKEIISLHDIIQKNKKTRLTVKEKGAAKKAIKYIFGKTELRIKINSAAGINDAYTTAMVCGLTGVFLNAAGAVTDSKRHSIKVRVKPVFDRQFLSIKADCIIALTPANIIIGYIIYKINKRW
ncbi:MAG: hypothetical protein PHO15_06600 [Eubacteriales bacterium]|nr:hypothetical protein [Eubacteriales bacterium]